MGLIGSNLPDTLRPCLCRSEPPAGWPNCAVEERYSHAADGSFYYCRLTPSPGSDIKFDSEYEVKNAVVEADGSWAFNELVANGGNTEDAEMRRCPGF